MTSPPVPFNKPSMVGLERAYIDEAVDRLHLSADGAFTARCRDILIETLGVSEVLLTTSCTDALEMAALLLEIEPGDEVVVPAYTFVSTANAFVLRGARPVFVDIRPDTLSLDEELVGAALTGRTKAVVPVHYAGIPCAIDRIVEIASGRGVAVVEDNAHGLFARWRGRPLGSFGRLATLSFHETKNISCGEGGALLINDPELVERAYVLRDKGTDRRSFRKGAVDKYTWVDLGSSFGLSDVLAAILFAQLEARTRILDERREIWGRYDRWLSETLDGGPIGRPVVPAGAEPAHHMYYLTLPTPALRDELIADLAGRGIHAVFHYTPLHRSAMAARLGPLADCPVTDRISSTLVRLPFFNGLQPGDQRRVVDAVARFCADRGLRG